MDLVGETRAMVVEALDALEREGHLPEGLDLSAVTVEPPRDPAHGDMATNAAMVLARPARMKPRDIAALVAGRLGADPRIASAEVAGPGFLNLRLAPAGWLVVIPKILGQCGLFGPPVCRAA